MEHITHNFAQGSLFACTEQLFKQLNIELHSSEDLPILPQNFFDKELYRAENKIHQLIQQLYVAGMVGTEKDSLAVIAVELATTAATRTHFTPDSGSAHCFGCTFYTPFYSYAPYQ